MIDEIYSYRQGNLLNVPISEEWETLCIKFEEMLPEEQLITFHKLLDIQSTTSADEMKAAYKAGFKDGMALMSEIQK